MPIWSLAYADVGAAHGDSAFALSYRLLKLNTIEDHALLICVTLAYRYNVDSCALARESATERLRIDRSFESDTRADAEVSGLPSLPQSRVEFCRRAGRLGLAVAGAAALGFPLLESRRVDAQPLVPPKDVIAAGGGATIKIGHIDGFTGLYAAAALAQSTGLQQAVDDATRRFGGRVTFEVLRGDDTSTPIIGKYEAQRLIEDAKVDALVGCVASGAALTVSDVAQRSGVLYFSTAHATDLTGVKANRCTIRTTSSNAMLAAAVAPALLQDGNRWFFVVANTAFGRDAYGRLRDRLRAAGGSEAGSRVHASGETEFGPIMRAAGRSGAQVLVLCNYGPDTTESVKSAIDYGLNRRMRIGGILCGNESAAALPVRQIGGSVFGYLWGPDVHGTRTQEIYSKLSARAQAFPPNWRQYLGYVSGELLLDRIMEAGTTDTSSLIAACEGYRYDAGKVTENYVRKCDHQAIQDTYAARIRGQRGRRSPDEFFTIERTQPGDLSPGGCDATDSRAAATLFAAQAIPHRDDYAAIHV